MVGGQVNASTDAGSFSFSLSGTGQAATAQLAVSPSLVSLGGTSTGGHLSGTATFSNVGATALKINAIVPPSAPFSATSLPNVGSTLGPGESVTVGISFDPTQVGNYNSTIEFDTTGGNGVVGVSASAGTPGVLKITSEANDFGAVPIGATASKTFTITNTGGTDVTITKSKPPFGGAFAATTSLQEGTTITPGTTLTEAVTYSPTTPGPSAGTWQVNGDDSTGLHQVQFTGTGVVALPGTLPGISGSTTARHPRVAAVFVPKIVPARANTASLRSTFITYTAMAPGTTTHFTLQRGIGGRPGPHGCARITARNRHESRCIRFVNITTFTHLDRVGINRIRLAGPVPIRDLVPGIYRLRSVMTDATGARHTVYSVFRVVPAARRHSLHR